MVERSLRRSPLAGQRLDGRPSRPAGQLRAEPLGQAAGAGPFCERGRLPSLPSFPLAGGRAVAYCSPAACRLHRAEEREREERERRAYHRHPGVRERALCAFVWVGARMTVAAETEGRLWVSAHNR